MAVVQAVSAARIAASPTTRRARSSTIGISRPTRSAGARTSPRSPGSTTSCACRQVSATPSIWRPRARCRATRRSWQRPSTTPAMASPTRPFTGWCRRAARARLPSGSRIAAAGSPTQRTSPAARTASSASSRDASRPTARHAPPPATRSAAGWGAPNSSSTSPASSISPGAGRPASRCCSSVSIWVSISAAPRAPRARRLSSPPSAGCAHRCASTRSARASVRRVSRC